MLKTRHSRKTYYLGVEDALAIADIKTKYGLSTDSDAVRLALRLLAESQVQVLAKKRGK